MTILGKKQMSEEDIKLNYITPVILKGWKGHITMETKITDGRINIRGNIVARSKPKFADYMLYLNDGKPIAVVEAKDNNHSVSHGLQQAMTYDNIAMRLMDILMAIPSTLLAIAISAALGSGVVNTMIAVGVGSVPLFARVTRSAVLSVREQEYIESSKAIGAGNMRIIFKHIIPNAFASALVIFTLRLADNVLIVSSLSFLGLGVQPPTPEWGSMISAGRQYIRDFYPIVVCPGLAIMVTLIAFNLLGDGLRDALDPRLKQ